MDNELAKSYIGKHILVGITYLNHNEELLEQTQYHGEIIRINENEGVVIRVNGTTEETSLPPMLESITVANEGDYTLRSTGEVVSNPDLLSSWTSIKDDPAKGEQNL